MRYQYNSDKTSTYLQFLDAKNLHKWGMTQKLPGRRIDDFTPWKLDQFFKKDEKEYILEVDRECPNSLQKNHTKLPILAKSTKIRKVGKVVKAGKAF